MIELIRVHEASTAFHIAACCQVYEDVGAATITHAMDAMHTCIGSLIIASGVKAFHSPKEFWVRGEHVLERTMPVTGFAEKNPACLFQNLSFDNCGFIG